MAIGIIKNLEPKPRKTSIPGDVDLKQTMISDQQSEQVVCEFRLAGGHDVWFQLPSGTPSKSITFQHEVGPENTDVQFDVRLIRHVGTSIDGSVGIEDGDSSGGAGAGGEALGERLVGDSGLDDGVEALIERFRRHPHEGFVTGDELLAHHIDRDLNRRGAGALAGTRDESPGSGQDPFLADQCLLDQLRRTQVDVDVAGSLDACDRCRSHEAITPVLNRENGKTTLIFRDPPRL